MKKSQKREWLGLVPIQMHQTNQTLDQAVSFAIEMALVAGQKTVQAADDLVKMVVSDPDAQENVRRYVEGFKTNLTGNYYWSYVYTPLRTYLPPPLHVFSYLVMGLWMLYYAI